jgi:histidinol-phosphate aminotransferase
MQPRDLSSHSPYVPGRGAEEVARELGMDADDLTKLSSNENPHGPSPDAVDALREYSTRVHVYPTTAHTDLTAALAERWALDPEQVWVSAGADGALDYLARAMLSPDDRVLVPEPGFSYYPMSARYHHGTVATYQLSKAADFEQSADTVLASYDGERIVYLTTPHNPTGAEFAREDHENLAVTRTFSKAYGLAGLRIGWAAVPTAWADAYARVNTPFAANELALRAAMAALDDDDHLDRSVETARRSRAYIHDHLAARTWPSGGNFVLAEVGDASTVADAAQRRGVIVRDCSSFGLPECVRISCGTDEETRRAVRVLNDVLAEVGTA